MFSKEPDLIEGRKFLCELLKDAHGYTKIHKLSSPTKSINFARTMKILKHTGIDASKESVDDEGPSVNLTGDPKISNGSSS
ncbi:CLUMA_CG001490, isoform A [Clunio marinus]|uniref:CLUMA_CG001490, isoform A n=1 Tax=Clunio marinus TaxID=568069 RepID=A0A1J1HJW2_9DIPT|nr:CLUMA_CG001490, isoform A [Clunio marinus]